VPVAVERERRRLSDLVGFLLSLGSGGPQTVCTAGSNTQRTAPSVRTPPRGTGKPAWSFPAISSSVSTSGARNLVTGTIRFLVVPSNHFDAQQAAEGVLAVVNSGFPARQ
jgi:hypothetical protein